MVFEFIYSGTVKSSAKMRDWWLFKGTGKAVRTTRQHFTEDKIK